MTRVELKRRLNKIYGQKTCSRLMKYLLPSSGAGCWVWSGGCAGELGRPCVWLNGRSVQVARLFLEVSLGEPLTESYLACHKQECGNGSCVNPGHLYKGTPSQNLRDMWEWGARSKPNFSVGVK